MGDQLHHSQDRGGVTDLFTNATRLVPPELEDPRHWLGPVGQGPPEQLLTYLHEATHHWCFRSAVGYSLLLLAARAGMNADALSALSEDLEDPHRQTDDIWADLSEDWGPVLRAVAGDPRGRLGSRLQSVRRELELAIVDDVLRIELVTALLRPLAEGLACFAEYDAVSRLESNSFSPLPMGLVLNFAGPDRIASGPSIPEPIKSLWLAGELQAAARRSPLALSRKFDLLSSPFSSSSNGGYLLGYLTVKSLWRHLWLQDFRLLGETDLALMYMRSFFYEDLGFAALLVEPTRQDCSISSRRILDYLHFRHFIFSDVRKENICNFEQYAATPKEQRKPEFTPGLLRTPEQDEKDLQFVHEAADATRRGMAAEVFEFAASRSIRNFNQIVNRRDYLTACSVPVEVRRDLSSGLMVFWQGQPILTFPEEDVVQRAATADSNTGVETRLDVVLGTLTSEGGPLSRAAIITRGENVLACMVFGPPSLNMRAVKEQVVTDFRTRDALFEQGRQIQWLAQQIIKKNWRLQIRRNEVFDQLHELVDLMYQPTALAFAGNHANVSELAEKMAAPGLLGVVKSPRLLQNLTLLGLHAGLDAHKSSVTKALQRRGVDLDSTLKHMNRLWDEEGFPPRDLGSGDGSGLVLPFM
ncbi:hypothetical protein [Streptomyces sp. NPDC058457]|uniref:hypothetical protein n=1 Tax=Streptomyces sp. NPDC058457 TaxID=3346507 RepID=UPI00364F7B13